MQLIPTRMCLAWPF